MVTSNKLSDRKVVKMDDENNTDDVVPQRTLIGEVNEHITCPLCRGYYIDATTIVECLHSFCRSCIISHLLVKSYCPVCEMMINSAKPNIKLDKALQDIVYKLVPGLFQKEMERRQTFYASRPGPAATATPEQRGEDTERIIFSPEDVISFSLEYVDATDADSISSKSSDSNDLQPNPATTRRYLQCPAVVNINHLKKFLSMKFDIDSSQFAIDILYKKVSLPDYYTLMDIAYIYNWKRNEPMRFFYQIIDYIAIRNRLFDVNRKGSHFRDRKSSPASAEDTNVSSPALNLNDQGSEASSGTDSPMLEDNSTKQMNETLKNNDKTSQQNNDQDKLNATKSNSTSSKKTDEDTEKSQFLNSFELTPKSNCVSVKTSPNKSNLSEEPTFLIESAMKTQVSSAKADDKLLEPMKRKLQIPPNTPELKKLKIELEKPKAINSSIVLSGVGTTLGKQNDKAIELPVKTKDNDGSTKNLQPVTSVNSISATMTMVPKDNKQQSNTGKQQTSECSGMKRTAIGPQNISSPKRKPNEFASSSSLPLQASGQKTIKLQIPKTDAHTSNPKSIDTPRPPVKKMPDLKPSTPSSQVCQQKAQPLNKVRMDFLANNSDPTIDRSKILSQVTTSLSPQNLGQASGDPLKSLFDSCKINIPSSLSITLTDQKLDSRNPNEANLDPKKGVVNKNLSGANINAAHKVPSPPVHNYIEILKLPDTEPKKQSKPESNTDTKPNSNNKTESPSTPPKPTKSSETSAKGPVPNLKPISDTKLGKQSGNYASPITFQQTFEQQVQFMQCDKKSKPSKNKAQVPKLVPASPKTFSAASKPNSSITKPNTSIVTVMENKTGTALDLSTPHTIQNQYGQQQQTLDKVFETMQSIANLAKKQNLPTKGLPISMSQSNVFPSSRPMNTGVSSLRIPSTSNINQIKIDKVGPTTSQINRQDMSNKSNQLKSASNANPTILTASPGYQMTQHASPSIAHPSPRSQTRSPSSSPKLVIAEEKQTANTSLEQNMNQSNQISSTQLPLVSLPKTDPPKATPGPSKSALKPVKTLAPAGKMTGIRQPITPTMKTNPPMTIPADYLTRPQLMAQQHHALLRQQMEMAWLKAHRPYDLLKSISSMTHQTQNDFNNKDKQ